MVSHLGAASARHAGLTPENTWLRVPLGKLATETRRSTRQRHADAGHLDPPARKPSPDPASPDRTADFVFTQRGLRLGATRLRNGLIDATTAAGLLDRHGVPITITPHKLCNTYATSLESAGISLRALMALLGHVTPEMTLWRVGTVPARSLRRPGQDRAQRRVGPGCRSSCRLGVPRPAAVAGQPPVSRSEPHTTHAPDTSEKPSITPTWLLTTSDT